MESDKALEWTCMILVGYFPLGGSNCKCRSFLVVPHYTRNSVTANCSVPFC
jgi:hypothetical protein